MPSPAICLAVLGCVAFLCMTSASAIAQNGPPRQILPEGIRGGSETVPEPRVEIRKYVFTDTGEELPYSVFVSSKVRKDQKAPLIIALRGFTGTTLTFVRGTAVDLAEAGGYILVGAIGYNNRAGFGVQAGPRPARLLAHRPAAPRHQPVPPRRRLRRAHSLRSSAAPRRPIQSRSRSTAKRT